VWLPTNQRPQPLSRAEEQLEWIVIMKLGTLVGVHGDRAVAVAWMWPGFAGLARRSSQEGEAVDDDGGSPCEWPLLAQFTPNRRISTIDGMLASDARIESL
jgi:hypothetical protein